MDNTLIVFASKHGAVEKCARELFLQLEGKVDLCNLNQREYVPDLFKYDTIIIGGSIRSGEIQKEIADFCTHHLDVLVTKRLGLFICCLYTGLKAQQQLDDAFPETLNQHAIARDYFGAEIDSMKLSFWERIVTNQMIENENLVVKLSKDRIDRFAGLMKTY